MRESSEQSIMRDRTHRSSTDGDYLNHTQYMRIAVSLCVTHFFLEFMYIGLGCTPMAIVNIFSIFCYMVSIVLILRKKTLYTVWIMIIEVFAHVICASIFLGVECGFQLWLFGTIASVFLPFYNPDLSMTQRKQIGIFSLIVISTYMILTALNNRGLFPTKYHVSPEITHAMYYVNSFLGFGAIMLYTQIYNDRVAENQKELKRAADHDFLTGIFNRQRMQKILDAEILREQKLSQSSLSVAIADIDYFKKINDTYGHITGDEALIELTKIFRRNESKGLLYGRWGGEEFLLIAPEDQPYEQFAELLESIRKQVEGHEFVSDGKTVKFTISIGAASFEKSMTSEMLVNMADDRLYKAKETGRNKIVYM